MGVLDILKNIEANSTKLEKQKSLYEIIVEALVNGELPVGFSLPEKVENGIAWMDGAADGVCVYHMSSGEEGDKAKDIMGEALKAATRGDFKSANISFARLGEKTRALSVIDEFQKYIMEHKGELNPGNIYKYALHAVTESADRETVKYGLAMLELLKTGDNEETRKIIRTIGLSDEFSLFAIFVMLTWEDGNNEVFQLAKRIHGWGRVHAVERIKPETDEIKRWLLLDGVHNNVMAAYSALECWVKSGAYDVLMTGPSKEEFVGIRDIINGLLDEGPAEGISQIDGREDILIRFLNVAKEFADSIEDYEAIRNIKIHYEDEDNKNAEIESLCNELLFTDRCKILTARAVKEGCHINMAKNLGLDYKDDVLAVMEADLVHKNHLCLYLMDNPEYKDKVLDVFRRGLALSELKAMPGTTMGLGKEPWKQRTIQFVLQELRRYPLEGQDFVEAALQSEPIITRNLAIGTLKSWVKKEGKPLAEILPECQALLTRLSEIEPDEKIKKNMDELISEKRVFG